MKENVKRTLTPKLRFPEFTEEWRPTTIGEVFNSDDKPVKATRFESDKILTVKLHANGVVRNERTGALTGGTNYFIRKSGQFIFSKIDLLNGAFGIVPKQFDGFYSSSDVPAFSFGTEHSPTFFLNWLTIRYRRLDIERTGTSATLKRVSPEKFWELPILLPTLPEQQKIAECLRSLDGLITTEGRKLAALRDHKRGLMQQLFPQPGETQPRLRFPEFRDKGEWEEKLIEDFFDVGSSKRVLQQDWTTQGVPFYRTRELVSLSKNEPFGSEIFISEDLFREISENYGLPAEGDFLVSGVGTLGISYQVQAQDRFYFKDGNVLWFKLKGGIVSTFFKYCFEADDIQNQILDQASISTVGTYTIQNAKVTKFSCPPNIEEQQKIADSLASLDNLITAQTQKLATLKQHKHGLMQQIFPSPEEQ